uniref:Uncharacterized protein n=1 Tax=Arundo donax TaxID=35708 RepID=A0A0A8YZ13_ARUDO
MDPTRHHAVRRTEKKWIWI